jgi:adenylate cyclase
VTHEYATRKNAIPLPATFTIDLGQRISKAQSGMLVRLTSNHPWRSDGGPNDPFERKALDVLTQRAQNKDANLAYHEFTEIDGQPFLRYAKGQLMKQSCVKCHNSDMASPRRDWHEGDLAGVLIITRPLDEDIARTNSGLRGAFLVMALTTLSFVAVALGFLIRARVVQRAV